MMRPAISLLLIFLSIHWATAQMAPNFTVTDYEGNSIDLYNDFLDQNKTVVLKIFFTSCPPCNSIAPQVQALYEAWGEGMHQVEFIELSDKSFDSDSRVANYVATHGLSLRSVGADGGSLTAVTPYKDGTYGPWGGTPTFVVISPDKRLEYDVGGNTGSQSGMIQALDEALYRSGAVKPGENPTEDALNIELMDPDGAVIAGPFRIYFEPLVTAPDSLSPQEMTVPGDENNRIILTERELPGWQHYRARIESLATPDASHGITVLDLLRGQQHIIGVNPLSSLTDVMSIDVDYNKNPSNLDLLEIQQATLGLIDRFDRGNYGWGNDCARLDDWFLLTDLKDIDCSDLFTQFKKGNLVR